MSTRTFLLLPAILLIAWGAVTATAHSQSSEVEVRVAAQRLDDGRTEFALQERQADGAWGERRLPRSRFFPASATVDRWLASSPLTVAGVEVRIATRLVADGRMEFALQERQADGAWGERRLPRSRFFPAGAAVGRWLASSALTVRAPTLDVDVDVVPVEVRIATQLVLDGRMEFALQERQADGEWGERRLPRSRFFPATPAVGRWLASSALTVSAPGAGSDAVGVEVRLAAQRVADGRTEFALQERQADGAWGERRLPRSRFFPASATVGRWLASSALTLSVPAAAPSPPSTAPAAPGTPESERAALVAFYEATDGENWTDSTNWLSDRPIDEWYGVRMDPNGRVFGLFLPGNGLSGSLPAELDSLTELRLLFLANNELTGCISDALADLRGPALELPSCSGAALARAALVALYNATDGPNWSVNTNWLSDRPISDWAGVYTDRSGRVSSLSLRRNGLNGPIPAELAGLAGLQGLDLAANDLSGPIPAWLGNLAGLEWLNLSGNELSGPIPPALGSLADLEVLNLSGNELSGPIPPALGSLADLEVLNLSGNELSGPIPPALGSLAGLEVLNLSGNQLSGPVPAWLGNLRGLNELHLSGNELSGPIPTALGNLSDLRELGLGANELDGMIPAELGGLTRLRWLSLGGNDLSGPIPPALGSLTNLEQLHLAGNNLSGPIPPALGSLTNLEQLHLAGNNLSGPITAELESIAGLRVLSLRMSLDGNEFTGCVPDSWRDVPRNDVARLGLPYCGTPDAPPPASDWHVLLALHETMGGGANWLNDVYWLSERPIDSWHGVTTDSSGRVTELALHDNDLSGSIPAEIGMLSRLEVLRLSGNELSGPIPAELGMLSSLESLTLHGNQLSGSIPAELGMLRSLEFLTLQGNQLSGSIPAELGMLRSLELLSLQGNRLNGSIPAALGSLTNLRALYLAGNDLSGSIPAALGGLPNLAALSLRMTLEGNEFTGCIPDGLGDVPSNDLPRLALPFCGMPGVPAPVSDWHTLIALYRATDGANWDSNDTWLTERPPSEWGGVVTDADGRVTYLSLRGLSGSIPAELGMLTNLETLTLSGTQLSGSIPAELGRLTKLVTLTLRSTQLSGSIPAEFGMLTNLEALILTGNELSGSIPAEIGMLTNLETLELQGNQLTGPIPAELGLLTNLETLRLSGGLTGCIPDGLRHVRSNNLHLLGLPFCEP